VKVTKFCISEFCVRCSKPRVFLNDPVYISLIHRTLDPTRINIPFPWTSRLVTDAEALVDTDLRIWRKIYLLGLLVFFYRINLKDNITPCSTDLTENILIQYHCQEIVAIYLKAHTCHVGAMLKYCVLMKIHWQKWAELSCTFHVITEIRSVAFPKLKINPNRRHSLLFFDFVNHLQIFVFNFSIALYLLLPLSHILDVHGSVHRNVNLIEKTNKMQPYSRIYYSNVS